jgi:hypothetical protein
LGTHEHREAVLRATLEQAEWLTNFEAESRTLKPQTLEVITPGIALLLAERIRAKVLPSPINTEIN